MENPYFYSRTTTELSPEVSSQFPGDDALFKVTFFLDTFLPKFPSDLSAIDVLNKNETISLSGEWSDLTIVHQIIQNWINEQKAGVDKNVETCTAEQFDVIKPDPSGGVKLTGEPSADVKDENEAAPIQTGRKRGRPRKRKVSTDMSEMTEVKTQPSDMSTENTDQCEVSLQENVLQTKSRKRRRTSESLDNSFTSDTREDEQVETKNNEDESAQPECIELTKDDLDDAYTTTEDGKFLCQECKFTSKKLNYMKQHIQRNHSAKRFRCPACPQTFGLKKAFSEHYSYYHKQHKFACTICDKTFPKNYLLKAHMDNHVKVEATNTETSIEVLKCTECDFVVKKPRYLQLHMSRAHKERTLCCPHCDKKYSVDRDLKAHLKTHTETHDCNICGKRLKSKIALDSHIKVIHEGKANDRPQKSYLCVTCGKMCRNKTVYTIHMNKMHLDVKPFACSICDMEFFAKSNLKQHEMTHSEKREFKCNICDKSFKQRQGLRIHKIIHVEDRPHKCETCNKTFTQAGALVRHMRIHSGDRPYHCQFCDARFSDYSILRRHLLGIHKIDDPTLVRKSLAKSREDAKERQKNNADDLDERKPANIPKRGPASAKSKIDASLVEKEKPEELILPVVILPDLSTPGKVSLASDAPSQQITTLNTAHPLVSHQQELVEGVPMDLGETVVTQILSQPTQLFLTSPGLSGIQQEGDQGGAVQAAALCNGEEVFVMNQQPEGEEDRTVVSEPTDAMIISQDALPPNVAMYEHEGQTYALVFESSTCIAPTQ